MRTATTQGAALLGLLLAAALAPAQEAPATLQPIVISGSGPDRQRWVAPASIDVIGGEEIRDGQLQINLSESLGRVPGLVIQNRQNYAQDLQVSIRGFGARSTFGVRGVRLFVDGIPANAPDGQGQTANFPLGLADRIEVVRGPYAALYGSSSGGVIALSTADGGPARWLAGVAGGADGLHRLSAQATGQAGSLDYAIDATAFRTDGLRPQSAADRSTLHLKVARPYDGGRVVAIASRQVGSAQDPLGLTRAEFDADPYQTTAAARMFDTRKAAEQTQLGLAWQHRLGGGHGLELIAYGGQRAIVQFQAIPPAAQLAPGSPGGVIDLDRGYGGLNLRWRLARSFGDSRLTASAGLSYDVQTEQRRGWENFVGRASAPDALGLAGRLRRDETNRATALDPYAQVEWDSGPWTATAGLRQSRVRLRSADRYVAPGNPEDSGSTSYRGSMPVLGLRWRLAPKLQAYASAGRGLETPTLNEVAYRPDGSGGLNADLRASRSRSLEAGLRGRHADASWTATVFDIRSRDEIVVLANSGGRSVFRNAGRTERRGLELAAEWHLGRLQLQSALTMLRAVYAEGFMTCAAAPCSTPDLAIPAGHRMPGIPRRQAFLQLAWTPGPPGATLWVEARHTGAVVVDDRNTDAAAAATVVNLGARFEQDHGGWQLRQFVRVDNVGNRRHAGSVIVNEGNGRFFETAPGRSFFAGVEWIRRWR